ncbi:MAG: gamma-glutamyltransferase family protein [Opitutales bacterium]|nr:gamma-glutamyltransferase family protein [Opitutales bacterium]
MNAPRADLPRPGRAAVATSQRLAADAGRDILAAGGNAVDSALATAIALTVTEPTSNGIGSDAFALVWDGQRLHGFNGSGRSPRAWSPERFAGRPLMPALGWEAVTVPGAVDTWVRLHRRFGRLPFARLFAPAIAFAREGFPLGSVTAAAWARARTHFADFADFQKLFFPPGFEPVAGAHFAAPEMADTLEAIAQTEGAAFYEGHLARAMVADAQAHGAALCLEDLSGHQGEWVEPLTQTYRGHTLAEIPPNGQGLATLIALGILERILPDPASMDLATLLHAQWEAMKIGLAETAAHVGEPAAMRIDPQQFLDPSHLDARARAYHRARALPVRATLPRAFGTVNLATADADGCMVSFIQSNFWGFGSGIVVPGTGISLQNRGFGFSTDPAHPNAAGPAKRPFHTIIPGFLFRGQEPLMAFGLMGGQMQPQGHLQMVHRLVDLGEHPQNASDAPRWQIREDFQIITEEGFSPDMLAALAARGHSIIGTAPAALFGGMQAVLRLPDGTYSGASDHRKDGHLAAF